MAFFVSGAEDLVHGFLRFGSNHGWIRMLESSLGQLAPGTFVTGRFLMGLILLSAPFLPARLWKSDNPKRDIAWPMILVVWFPIVATILAFNLPSQRFFSPTSLSAGRRT